MADDKELTAIESLTLLKHLAKMGFRVAEELNPEKGILGKNMKVVPVRVGQPGTEDEGVVFGEPKRDTKYPIDRVKVIQEKDEYYAALYSTKAGDKPITYKKIMIVPSEYLAQQRYARAPRQLPEARAGPMTPANMEPYQRQEEPLMLPAHEEAKRLTAGRQPIALLPAHQEPLRLPEARAGPVTAANMQPYQRREAPKQLTEGTKGKYPLARRGPYPLAIRYPERRFPEPPPPPPPTPPQRPRFMVTVDSAPMQEVHVNVEVKTTTRMHGTLKPKNYATALGVDTNHPSVSHAMRGATAFANSGPYPDRAAAEVALLGILSRVGITDEDLTKLILDTYYGGEPKWITLDKWRSDSLDAEGPVPFSLARTTQYLATKAEGDRLTPRYREVFGGTYYGIGLESAGLDDKIVERNTYTIFYLSLPGTALNIGPQKYRFKADTEAAGAKFHHWEITYSGEGAPNLGNMYDIRMHNPTKPEEERLVRSVRNNVVTHWDPTLEIDLASNVKLVAFYHKEASIDKTRRPGQAARYQTGSPLSQGGIRGAAAAAVGTRGVRERIKGGLTDVERRELKRDPYLLAAINRGKRMLNRYARAKYSSIFNPLNAEFETRREQTEQLREASTTARRNLRRMIRQNRQATGLGRRQIRGDNDLLNGASTLIEQLTSSGNDPAMLDALSTARQNLELFIKARDSLDKDYTERVESAAAELENYLKNMAKTLMVSIARRYRMPIGSADEVDLGTALDGYATDIAQKFVLRGRTMRHAFMRGLGITSNALETGGAAGTNILYNIFQFIFGPWTITTLFTLLLFFFTLTFVGYNVQILWMMPIIGAGFTFLLNFSDSFQPLDWVTHLSSGAIMGYSAALFLLAFGAENWGFIGMNGVGSTGFWIWWAILGFIGLFQFYQHGGWKIVLQGGIIILLLSYLAFGPYSAYFHQAVGQVKAPVELAYRYASNAITDVWLLATNPTEWYARQQLVNVRPERPLDFPKGIELASLEALPPSVPSGQEFALAAIIKNDGILDAKDVLVSVDCTNQWCNSRSVQLTSPVPIEDDARLNELKERYGIAGDKIISDIKNGRLFYIKDNLPRGTGEIITVKSLAASFFPQQRGLTNFAKINFNVSYAYATNSSLQVSVINSQELQRLFREGQAVFKPVLAVDKGTPARLSLNVGPQPLQTGQGALLLVSISNTRDKSKVVLPRGTKVIIRVPHEIAVLDSLRCGEQAVRAAPNNPYYKEGFDTIAYEILPQEGQNAVEVLPFEFNSIYGFICEFATQPDTEINTVTSSFITAELPRYIFRLEQTKDVPVTPRLGILYDPFEKVCNKCGDGRTNICDADECHSFSEGSNKCWYSGEITLDPFESATNTPRRLVGNVCHSCGLEGVRSCSMFPNENSCEGEDAACKLTCKWNANAVNERGIPVQRCESAPADRITLTFTRFSGDIAEKIIRQAKEAGFDKNEAENILKIAAQESGLRHCKDGTLNCGNTNQDNVLGASDGKGYGVFQLNQVAHPSWYDTSSNGCNGELPYDLDCNIFLGVNYILNLKTDYANDPAKLYTCLSISYSGWDAIYRYYNGWNTDCSVGDKNYVDNVKGQDVSRFRTLIDSIYSGLPPVIAKNPDLMGRGILTGLKPEVQVAFDSMKTAAKQAGFDFVIVSGYRSFTDQLGIWNSKFASAQGTEQEKVNKVAEYSAIPGLSRHHWGTEVDINSVDPAEWQQGCVGNACQVAVYEWLKTNAKNYGFCQPYDMDKLVKTEPWHWSYKPISSKLTPQHMSDVTANDILGLGIAGENTIITNFDYYHRGFVSDINPDCISTVV